MRQSLELLLTNAVVFLLGAAVVLIFEPVDVSDPELLLGAIVLVGFHWANNLVAEMHQLRINAKEGTGGSQLQVAQFGAYTLENMGWAIWAIASGNPVFLIARIHGLYLDQIMIGQILYGRRTQDSTALWRNEWRYTIPAWIAMGLFLFVLLAGDAVGVRVAGTNQDRTLIAFWLANVVFGIRQLHINWAKGWQTLRAYSPLLPIYALISGGAAIVLAFSVPGQSVEVGFVFAVNLIIPSLTLLHWLWLFATMPPAAPDIPLPA